MPYIGLFPFLPQSAFLILTSIKLVSMPYIGLFPFLPRILLSLAITFIVCQCPTSGFFHFYLFLKIHIGYRSVILCQCPTSGFFHFYIRGYNRIRQKVYLCQCPTSGFFHFYHFMYICHYQNNIRVNALHRAFSISTTDFNYIL